MHRIHKHLLIVLLMSVLFAGTVSAQSIHVEWGYTPPSEPEVTGFKLYQEGTAVCVTQNPNAISIDCDVTLTANTTNFTLTATFSDNTESPHSAPFSFNSGVSSSTETTASSSTETSASSSTETTSTSSFSTIGNKLFTFTWEQPSDLTNISGYRFYLNSTLLCATSNVSDTSIACKANLVPQAMTFSMSQVYSDGSESTPSDLLVFDPTTYPELYNFKLVTFTWDFTGDSASIAGFRVYQNNQPICQTTDTAARQLACTIDVPSGTVSYAVTAIAADTSSTETNISNLLTYMSDGTTTDSGTTALQANIQAAPVTGTTPLSVNFDATGSTGTINQYHWDFGDGSTASTSTTVHEYTSAGTFSAQLTVTDATGNNSTTIIAVTATEATTPVITLVAPTAVISTTAAAGPAPLAVSFDGSGSKADGSASIKSYTWSFGDGTTATGSTASHTFTSAGTYETTLTVTDTNGLTSATNTPVIVTTSVANVAPKASICATTTSGTFPLTVSFDGSCSTDSDGTIASYVWSFGDGSAGSGKSVSHTFTTAAEFIVTLQVTDDQGATGTATTKVTAQEETATDLNIETGEVAVTGAWVHVSLSNTFQNPIIIAGPASYHDTAPGVIRLRNVTATGFDICFDEWNYLDGEHPSETVSYMVLEKGRHTLPDGSLVEAGSFAGGTTFAAVSFTEAFTKTPVILTTIASMNEVDTISGRMKNVTTSGFSYAFREQQSNKNTHVKEAVHYLAWEPGSGSVGNLQYQVGNTAKAVKEVWYPVTLAQPFTSAPLVMADMQTTADTDPCALRIDQISPTGFKVKVEEEQSKDSEVLRTAAETVGYIALSQKEEKVLATFTWEFDAAQEANISGFDILANGEKICNSSNPADRQVSCEMNKPTAPTAFTIQSIDTTGTAGNVSNSLSYAP